MTKKIILVVAILTASLYANEIGKIDPDTCRVLKVFKTEKIWTTDRECFDKKITARVAAKVEAKRIKMENYVYVPVVLKSTYTRTGAYPDTIESRLRTIEENIMMQNTKYIVEGIMNVLN